MTFSLPRKNDFGVFSALCKSKGFMLQKRGRAA